MRQLLFVTYMKQRSAFNWETKRVLFVIKHSRRRCSTVVQMYIGPDKMYVLRSSCIILSLLCCVFSPPCMPYLAESCEVFQKLLWSGIIIAQPSRIVIRYLSKSTTVPEGGKLQQLHQLPKVALSPITRIELIVDCILYHSFIRSDYTQLRNVGKNWRNNRARLGAIVWSGGGKVKRTWVMRIEWSCGKKWAELVNRGVTDGGTQHLSTTGGPPSPIYNNTKYELSHPNLYNRPEFQKRNSPY